MSTILLYLLQILFFGILLFALRWIIRSYRRKPTAWNILGICILLTPIEVSGFHFLEKFGQAIEYITDSAVYSSNAYTYAELFLCIAIFIFILFKYKNTYRAINLFNAFFISLILSPLGVLMSFLALFLVGWPLIFLHIRMGIAFFFVCIATQIFYLCLLRKWSHYNVTKDFPIHEMPLFAAINLGSMAAWLFFLNEVASS